MPKQNLNEFSKYHNSMFKLIFVFSNGSHVGRSSMKPHTACMWCQS